MAGRARRTKDSSRRSSRFFVPPKALFSRLTRSDSKLEAGGDREGRGGRRALCCTAYLHIHKFISPPPPPPPFSPLNFAVSHSAAASAAAIKSSAAPLLYYLLRTPFAYTQTQRRRPTRSQAAPSPPSPSPRAMICVFSPTSLIKRAPLLLLRRKI